MVAFLAAADAQGTLCWSRMPGGDMNQGAVLIVVIALIIAYIVTRTRRRMGFLVTPKTWLVVMIAVIVGVLALWAAQTH
jgi:multisubunit Na+/H+ antiporter MnhB subunit